MKNISFFFSTNRNLSKDTTIEEKNKFGARGLRCKKFNWMLSTLMYFIKFFMWNQP